MSDPAIVIESLRKSYSQGWFRPNVQAVNGISFSIPEGSVVGLIGPNGAGKTTTIFCLLGLLLPDEGDISIFGEAPGSQKARRQTGYQSEIFHTYDFLKPEQALSLYGRLSGLPAVGLDNKIMRQLNRLGLGKALDQKVGGFSKGMKQRLGVAQALLHEPDLLILDEPFTGLDPQGRKQISEIIFEEKEKGKTVFFSSHILSDIERLCDDVIMLREGKVVLSGGLQNIMTTEESWMITVSGWKPEWEEDFKEISVDNVDGQVVELECLQHQKREVLQKLLAKEADITGIRKKSVSLEQLYMEMEEKTGEEV
ncbi:MAG: ABC transporter ATP-binding protein [Balneolaceae bacterium]|nr:ABC transporter ATP-binding protein [Balneolaceae bacterium]